MFLAFFFFMGSFNSSLRVGKCSELQLLEEPPVLAALVALLKFGPHHVSSLLLLHGILQQLLVQVSLVKADINGVPGGHHVVVVDHLKERLDLGPLLDLLLGHLLGDLPWVPVNTSNQGMAERLVASSLVRGLHDNCLSPCIPARKQQDDLAALHDFPHDDLSCRSESSNKS